MQFNIRFLYISQKLFVKSFYARLKSIRDIQESNECFINLSLINSEELLRIAVFMKLCRPLPERGFFNLRKKSSMSFFSESFSLYNACFYNLLFISYLPFWEAKNDRSILSFENQVSLGNPVFLFHKYIKNLFVSYPKASMILSFEIFQGFNAKSVKWLVKNFPFNKDLLSLYLNNFVLYRNPSLSLEFPLFFDYKNFNLFLFGFITNGLLCF